MENVNWGIPKQRTGKVEKFNTPVLTMVALGEGGTGRKFLFNKAAQELIGLKGEEHIEIGFINEGEIVLRTVSEETLISLKLTKTCTFSNKKTFDYITKLKSLSNDVENYLHLEANEGMFAVTSITNDGSVNEVEEIAECPTPVEEESVMDDTNSRIESFNTNAEAEEELVEATNGEFDEEEF